MDTPDELFEYVNNPDASYRFDIVSEECSPLQGARRCDLRLVSQTWRGIRWIHQVAVFIPVKAAYPTHAILIIGADGPCSASADALGRLYANSTGMLCAFLFDVPNQPLCDNRVEDALIAHTLLKRLETGERDWPVLFPMVKSACAAMFAITAYCRKSGADEILPEKFIVTGASKRGWTTWLAAASDRRVVGIAPVVFDNLKLFDQMPHQLKTFDHYSDQISDYSESGLLEKMMTPEGYLLAQSIDPYTYRSGIQIPKLIINGSNDPYWATDAITLYWDDLEGPKNVLVVPNQPHSINDPSRVDAALIEFACLTAKSSTLPAISNQVSAAPCGGASIRLFACEALTGTNGTNRPPVRVTCWSAYSASLDFRLATWSDTQMANEGGGAYTCIIPGRPSMNIASFAEAFYEGGSSEFSISTPMSVTRWAN